MSKFYKETIAKSGLITRRSRSITISGTAPARVETIAVLDQFAKGMSVEAMLIEGEDWAITTLKNACLPPHSLGVIVSSDGKWEDFPKNWKRLGIKKQREILKEKRLLTSIALTEGKLFSSEYYAARIVSYAHSLRQHIKNKNARDAAFCAINFQSAVMTAFIKFGLEKHALKGRDNEIKGKIRADQTNRKKAIKRIETDTAIIKDVREMLIKHQNFSREQIYQRVAGKNGLSSRTVRTRFEKFESRC